MPTLPLYDPAPPHPDGWHRVTAPGGYETWHFDAEDEEGDLRIIVTFSQGSSLDGEYRRLYLAFLDKPTKRLPPVPAESPSVSFVLWQKGETLARFAYRYPPEAFDASPAGLDLRAGPHRVVSGAGGTFALTVGEVLSTVAAARVSADLWFTPKFSVAPIERRFPSRIVAGADHFWVIANPLCAVSGTVRLIDAPSLRQREIHFGGRGYHDHRYGTAPLYATSGVSWVRGRALFDDHADAFQYVGGGAEKCYVRADASGIHDVAPSLSLDAATDVDLNPFAITSAHHAVRAGQREGTALCETARHGFSFPKPAGDFEDAP